MVHLCLGISECSQFLILSSLNHNRYTLLPKTDGERLFLNMLLQEGIIEIILSAVLAINTQNGYNH